MVKLTKIIGLLVNRMYLLVTTNWYGALPSTARSEPKQESEELELADMIMLNKGADSAERNQLGYSNGR